MPNWGCGCDGARSRRNTRSATQAQDAPGTDQETTLAASEEFDNRHRALASALSMLNDREGLVLWRWFRRHEPGCVWPQPQPRPQLRPVNSA
jgi:hypothetical protein